MRPDRGFPLPLQVLLWAAGNTLAGSATGLAVAVFRGEAYRGTTLLVSVLFGNVVGFTVFVASVALYPRVRELRPLTRAAMLAVALVSGSAGGTALVLYLFPLFVLRDPAQAIAVFAINAVLALIIGSVVNAYEGMRWRLAAMLREVEEVRLVEAQLQEQAARAELAALQARIHPHFLFNTLNTIASLIAHDPIEAESVVEKLAGLFRYTFRAAGTPAVRLEEELEFVEGYLEVERARFGARLRADWDVDAEARLALVPGLILQPLVENAVGHGIAPVPGGGTIRIAARVDGDRLRIEVVDDGAGLRGAPDTLIRDGHALANVRSRLRTLDPERGAIELARNPAGRGAVARLDIPFRRSVVEVSAAAGTSR